MFGLVTWLTPYLLTTLIRKTRLLMKIYMTGGFSTLKSEKIGGFYMVKIMLDPGHGGSDPGAVGSGLKEKDLNLEIAKRIRSLLSDYNATVYMTRETDKTVSLKERTDLANKLNVDYFMSIHINAGGGTGFESFIHSPLANNSKTAVLRNYVHDEIMKQIDFVDRGKKKQNFHVIRETRMSAILTESGFIDNVNDARKLKDNSFITKVAVGHVNGLIKAFNLKKVTTPPPPNDGELYKVQVGAFTNKDNAVKLANELKAKGFQTYITR